MKKDSRVFEIYDDKDQELPLKGVIFGCLGIIALALIFYLALVSIGAVLIVADPIASVDAVVVLSGDDGDR